LTVLFTRFVDSPRKQVTESVEHLAYIDTIYLGYFRQLQQIELGFMRHLLEKDTIVPEELEKFRSMVAESMDSAIESLGALRRNRTAMLSPPSKRPGTQPPLHQGTPKASPAPNGVEKTQPSTREGAPATASPHSESS
jgi:hypothetical protein